MERIFSLMLAVFLTLTLGGCFLRGAVSEDYYRIQEAKNRNALVQHSIEIERVCMTCKVGECPEACYSGRYGYGYDYGYGPSAEQLAIERQILADKKRTDYRQNREIFRNSRDIGVLEGDVVDLRREDERLWANDARIEREAYERSNRNRMESVRRDDVLMDAILGNEEADYEYRDETSLTNEEILTRQEEIRRELLELRRAKNKEKK